MNKEEKLSCLVGLWDYIFDMIGVGMFDFSVDIAYSYQLEWWLDKKIDKAQDIVNLELQIKKAISEYDFELAVALRDGKKEIDDNN